MLHVAVGEDITTVHGTESLTNDEIISAWQKVWTLWSKVWQGILYPCTELPPSGIFWNNLFHTVWVERQNFMLKVKFPHSLHTL